MSCNHACRSGFVHLDLYAGNTADSLVFYRIAIKVFLVGRIDFAIVSISTLVVAYALPVLVLGNGALGGFRGVAIDEVTAGHVVELGMTFVRIAAG